MLLPLAWGRSGSAKWQPGRSPCFRFFSRTICIVNFFYGLVIRAIVLYLSIEFACLTTPPISAVNTVHLCTRVIFAIRRFRIFILHESIFCSGRNHLRQCSYSNKQHPIVKLPSCPLHCWPRTNTAFFV